jgi:hypothetical protein
MTMRCEPDQLENWNLETEKLLRDETCRAELGRQAKEDAKGYTWLARAEKILDGFLGDNK